MLFSVEKVLFLWITFIKKHQTKLDFLNSILDYKLYRYKHQKLLIFYPKLSTKVINLKLTEYQRIVNRY